MIRTDIHQTVTLENNDEAESLAIYFGEHGVFAFVTDEVEVRASGDPDLIATLVTTWKHFWDNSDSGLIGLPMFIKEGKI